MTLPILGTFTPQTAQIGKRGGDRSGSKFAHFNQLSSEMQEGPQQVLSQRTNKGITQSTAFTSSKMKSQKQL